MKVYFAGKILGNEEVDRRGKIFNIHGHKETSNTVFNGNWFTYTGPEYKYEHGFINKDLILHSDVFDDNCIAIKSSEYIFVFIDCMTCYGTISEIGYAYGLGKNIIIYYTNNIDRDELWYVLQYGTSCINIKDEKDAWDHFTKNFGYKNMDYKKYLQTDYWKTLSDEVKKRDGNKCVLCGSDKLLNAHHRSYQYRGCDREKEKSNLTTLCNSCHKKFHDK